VRVRDAVAARLGPLRAGIGSDVDERLQGSLLLAASAMYAAAGVLWGVLYIALGEPVAGAIPLGYGILMAANVALFVRTHRMRRFRNSQLLLTLILPFLLQLSLGGFVASGAVVIWSFTSPLGALLVGNPRTAHRWFVAFVGLLVAAPFVQRLVRTEGAFDDGVRLAFFVGNLGALTAIVFVLTRYFARKKTEAYQLLDRERDKSEQLLLNVLPAQIADELRRGDGAVAEDFDAITILFADVVGFTRLSEELTSAEMVDLLNAVFSYFDELVARCGVEKIRTVGDSYMVVAGAPKRRTDHAQAIAQLAIDMVDLTEHVDHPDVHRLRFRIGINSGPATAGIIGHTKFHYDVWGDAVNVASRMESHGVPGRIQVGPGTAALIADDFVLEPRDWIEVKGKGRMQTWLLVGRRAQPVPAAGPSIRSE